MSLNLFRHIELKVMKNVTKRILLKPKKLRIGDSIEEETETETE